MPLPSRVALTLARARVARTRGPPANPRGQGSHGCSNIVSGDEWKDVLDPTNEILLHRKADGTIFFDILYPNNTKRSSDSFFLNTVDSASLEANKNAVAGAVHICFHGFGGGSCRGQELGRTNRADLRMSGGKIFYETISMKARTKYIKTPRCLPPCVARRVMIALVLYSGGDDGELFDLDYDLLDEGVGKTYADIFGLTHQLGFQLSRQLYACIANTLSKRHPDRNYDYPGLVSSSLLRALCMSTQHLFIFNLIIILPALCIYFPLQIIRTGGCRC